MVSLVYGLSMVYSLYGLSCLCFILSMVSLVYGLFSLWFILSMVYSLYGLSCLWFILSMVYSVYDLARLLFIGWTDSSSLIQHGNCPPKLTPSYNVDVKPNVSTTRTTRTVYSYYSTTTPIVFILRGWWSVWTSNIESFHVAEACGNEYIIMLAGWSYIHI